MDRIKLDLTPEQISAWGIPANEKEAQNRFPELWNKYGNDPGFFFRVYSEAATDWIEKKSAGKKLKSLSGHFSVYLKKRAKKAGTPEKTDAPDMPPFPIEEEYSSDMSIPLFSEAEKEPAESDSDFSEPDATEPLEPSASDESSPVIETVPSPPVQEQVAGNSLYLLDEDEETEYEPDGSAELIEQEGFGKHKGKRSALMTGFIVMFGLLLVAGIGMTALSKMFDEEPVKEEEPIEDFSSLHRGRVSNISQEMNKGEKAELKEQEIKTPEPSRESGQAQQHTENRPRPTGGGGYGANAKKDEEILAKYAQAIDPAAGHGAVAGNPRAQRRHFTPGSTEGARGGVFITGGKEEKVEKSLNIHNTQIKVRLEYSLRSTAATTVVAVVTDDSGKIPQGSKFYGTATGHVNKRTQIHFSKLVTENDEYSVKGFAIQGRDPGIESEVTDISKENIDAAIKQGLVQTASNIATHYAGAVGQQAGSAADNTVDPAGTELKKQQEANKMTQEYRVPAGTAFFIYLE
jgi:hypothetical protein